MEMEEHDEDYPQVAKGQCRPGPSVELPKKGVGRIVRRLWCPNEHGFKGVGDCGGEVDNFGTTDGDGAELHDNVSLIAHQLADHALPTAVWQSERIRNLNRYDPLGIFSVVRDHTASILDF